MHVGGESHCPFTLHATGVTPSMTNPELQVTSAVPPDSTSTAGEAVPSAIVRGGHFTEKVSVIDATNFCAPTYFICVTILT